MQNFKGHNDHSYNLREEEESPVNPKDIIKTIFIIHSIKKIIMKRYKKYSEFEDSVILNYIKQSPNNLTQAFRWSAFHLNRSVKAIEQHYYKCLCYNQANNTYYKPLNNTTKSQNNNLKNNKLTLNIKEVNININL